VPAKQSFFGTRQRDRKTSQAPRFHALARNGAGGFSARARARGYLSSVSHIGAIATAYLRYLAVRDIIVSVAGNNGGRDEASSAESRGKPAICQDLRRFPRLSRRRIASASASETHEEGFSSEMIVLHAFKTISAQIAPRRSHARCAIPPRSR